MGAADLPPIHCAAVRAGVEEGAGGKRSDWKASDCARVRRKLDYVRGSARGSVGGGTNFSRNYETDRLDHRSYAFEGTGNFYVVCV